MFTHCLRVSFFLEYLFFYLFYTVPEIVLNQWYSLTVNFLHFLIIKGRPIIKRIIRTFEVCLEDIQPCNIKNRDIYWRRYKEHCTQDNDAPVPFRVDALGPHTVLPATISCPVMFSWISSMVRNPFPFGGNFSYLFGKSQKSKGSKFGL